MFIIDVHLCFPHTAKEFGYSILANRIANSTSIMADNGSKNPSAIKV
jgi:hypothetical protein